MSKRIVVSQPATLTRLDETLKRQVAKYAKIDRRTMGDEIAYLVEQALAHRGQAKPMAARPVAGGEK